MRKVILLILLFSSILVHPLWSQTTNHWESAILKDDRWRYFVGSSEPPSAWRSLSFNDDSWMQGLVEGTPNRIIAERLS